ncbi:AP-5 complex subunit mu-1-like [Mytilus edulis]|uniref:AP-5 complex subunit mu-1-like n=1 Tax=Mytilus edulis TaxID=6550 RepID=UPI0039EE5E7C
MSLRKILIFSTNSKDCERQLLFSRAFPVAEKKAKQTQDENYVSLPSDQELVNGLLFELGHLVDGVEMFNPRRDSCVRVEEKPVVEVSTSTGIIWPLVVVEQKGLVYCCLPVVEAKERPPLLQISGVTLGFTLLCGLADYLRQNSENEIYQMKTDLYSILNIAVPFGKVMDVNIDAALPKLTCKTNLMSQKQPAWKPVLHKGKNHVYFAITEYIKAVLYGRENVPDVWDLYGTVSCKAELEGVTPDITINITSDGLPLDNILIHPCVQSADTSNLSSTDTRPNSRRIRFTPPLEMFTVCHYTVPRLQQLPVSGCYEMKLTGKTATLSVTLQLNCIMKNAMEYCELQIPFYNKGQISSLESNCTLGNTMLSPDKRILVWNIGSKFTTKTTQNISMEATVNFTDGQTTNSYEDPFCKGQNSYAQLFFKVPEFTHSGCYIDPKTVQVSPNAKFKLTTVQEYMTAEYKIWNIHGDILTSNIPISVGQT